MSQMTQQLFDAFSSFFKHYGAPWVTMAEGEWHKKQGCTWQWLCHFLLLFSILSIVIASNSPGSYAQEGSYTQESVTALSISEYLTLLRGAAEELQESPTAETAQSIQAELAMIKEIVVADGSTIHVAPLLGTTADDRPTAAEAEARITLLLAQIENGMTKNSISNLARLSAIFEQSQFAQQESFWQRIWRWLRGWLPDLAANENASSNSWLTLGIYGIGYAILGIGVVLLVYLLSLWIQNLLGGFLGDDRQGRRLTPDGELLNAAEAKVQAQQLARDGSFREAVRRLYLSALLTLDERRLLNYDRSNTNREVLATVRNNPALYEQLQPIIETFDDVWYGVHEPEQSTFDQYKSAVERLDKGSQ